MLRKATADLAAKGVAVTDSELQGQREMALEEAKKQLMADLASGRLRLEPGF